MPAPIRERQTIEVARDLPRHAPYPVADKELLDRVEGFKGRPVGRLVVVTGDLSMQILAGVRGVRGVPAIMLREDLRLDEDRAGGSGGVSSS